MRGTRREGRNSKGNDLSINQCEINTLKKLRNKKGKDIY